MGDKTNIEWTEATWNPTRGCSRVSQGCRNCYAETVANRFSGEGQPYEGLIARGGQWNGQVTLLPEKLAEPLRWQRGRMIFVDSMSDLFHEAIPFEFIAQVFAVMSVTTRHTFQVLTKRPKRMRAFFDWAAREEDGEQALVEDLQIADTIASHWPEHLPWKGYDNCGPTFPFENIWLGVSVEDQETANERIPQLLDTPAALRFISAEPLLGPVDLQHIWARMPSGGESLWDVVSPRVDVEQLGLEDDPLAAVLLSQGVADGSASAPIQPRVDWVIAGGESGPNARPMHPDWVRTLRDQCAAAGVPFFFKQWGEWAPFQWNADTGVNRAQDEQCMSPDGSHVYAQVGHRAGMRGPDDVLMARVGKKNAGRTLDGETWDQVPEVQR